MAWPRIPAWARLSGPAQRVIGFRARGCCHPPRFIGDTVNYFLGDHTGQLLRDPPLSAILPVQPPAVGADTVIFNRSPLLVTTVLGRVPPCIAIAPHLLLESSVEQTLSCTPVLTLGELVENPSFALRPYGFEPRSEVGPTPTARIIPRVLSCPSRHYGYEWTSCSL